MTDASDRHAQLEAQALALWESGALQEAADTYAQAIAACSDTDWECGQYHSGRAGVLAAAGRNDEARGEFELALAHALEHHGPTSPAVEVARYFLGNHCVHQGAYAAALMTVMPGIAKDSGVPALLRAIQARALAGLGRAAEARAAALAAVACAEDDQRPMIREALAELLADADG